MSGKVFRLKVVTPEAPAGPVVGNKIERFNKTAIAALPSPAVGRVDYQITKQPGLYLRVSSSGVKTYSVFARVKGGELERVTIGTTDKVTPEDVLERAKGIVSGMAAGRSYKAEARTKRGELTLSELIEDYITTTPMRVRSQGNFKDHHKRFIQDDLGKCKLTDVTAIKVARLHRKVSKQSEASANMVLAIIMAAFNWAKRSQLWAGDNPAAGIKKNRPVSRSRYLQPAELARFFAALDETEQPARDFFLVALLTGARKSNVLAMAWHDIDMAEGVWRIPAADAKAGEEMSIPLTTEALAVLQARKDAKGSKVWVFPAESESGHYMEPKRAWATLCKRAELADLRIHDLRRTMGSWLVRTGANTAINAKALGHKSMQAAAVYQRIADTDPVREAMQRATAGFMGGKA